MNAFPPQDDRNDDLEQLAEVFRRHAPAVPSPVQWQRVQQAVTRALVRPAAPTPGLRPFLGMVAALLLVALGGILYWTSLRTAPAPLALLPTEQLPSEPFAVAQAAEITIHAVEIADADRIVLGRFLLGQLEFARAGEIEVVETRPDPAEGWTPTIAPQSAMPLIVASAQEP
jgi:hypothetical protein